MTLFFLSEKTLPHILPFKKAMQEFLKIINPAFRNFLHKQIYEV